MFILRALGREREAKIAAAAYEHHGIDESAREITRHFLLENPGVNLMAQAIHIHELEPLEPRSACVARPPAAAAGGAPSP